MTRTNDDYVVAFDSIHTLAMNVCGDTSRLCNGKHSPAVFNEDAPGSERSCINLGDPATAVWSGPTADYAATVTYTGGDQLCQDKHPFSNFSIEMRFKCNPTVVGGEYVLHSLERPTECSYAATFQAAAACAPASAVSAIRSFASKSVLPCSLCEKAVPKAIDLVVKHGCGFVFDATAIGMCEAIGLGPEDPLSEVCAAAMIGGCKLIASQVAKHEIDPATVCAALKLC